MTNAIASGRAVGPLIAALEKLEKERDLVTDELSLAAEEIEAATIKGLKQRTSRECGLS